MPKNEYNNPIKESIDIDENKGSQEFSSVKEYDNSSKEYDKIPETGSSRFHRPSNKPHKFPIYICVGAAAGGAVIAANAVNTINDSKSEITISQVGENYVSFDYRTTDENLVMRLHNDFVNEVRDIDYSQKGEDGWYYGSYTFESLKSNTDYVVSLDGDKRFGETARVQKRVKTLMRNYYGEFSVSDSSMYVNGQLDIQVKSLNVELEEDEILSFDIIDENSDPLYEPIVYAHDSAMYDMRTIKLGEVLSEEKGYYCFNITNNDSKTELFRQSFSYGKIELDGWKQNIKTSYDYSKLNENILRFSVTFDGVEVEATDYTFTFLNERGTVVQTLTFETYQSVFELEISELIDIRRFTLNLTAVVKDKVETIVNDLQDLDTILTRPQDIRVDVDTSQILETNVLYVQLQYVDTLGYYIDFYGKVEADSPTPLSIAFDGHLHDRIAIPLDSFNYQETAHVYITFTYESVVYTLYDEDISIETEAWKNKVITNFDYSYLSGAKCMMDVTFDGLERAAENWKFELFDEFGDTPLETMEFQDYQRTFELNMTHFIGRSRYRVKCTADLKGKNHTIFDKVEDFSDVLSPIEEITVQLDNSTVMTDEKYRLKVNYVDVYDAMSITASIKDIVGQGAMDYADFPSGYHDWGEIILESVPPAKKVQLNVSGCVMDNIWLDIYDAEVDFYHTTLPSEIVVDAQFYSGVQARSEFTVSDILDFEEPAAYDLNTITAYISNDDHPDIPTWSQTYTFEERKVVTLTDFMSYGEVRLIVTIKYYGVETTICNKIVPLS